VAQKTCVCFVTDYSSKHGQAIFRNDKTRTIQVTVPIVAGQNKFTAYAFNTDNIKSADATWLLMVPSRCCARARHI
jgi:hypothetical protein